MGNITLNKYILEILDFISMSRLEAKVFFIMTFAHRYEKQLCFLNFSTKLNIYVSQCSHCTWDIKNQCVKIWKSFQSKYKTSTICLQDETDATGALAEHNDTYNFERTFHPEWKYYALTYLFQIFQMKIFHCLNLDLRHVEMTTYCLYAIYTSKREARGCLSFE